MLKGINWIAVLVAVVLLEVLGFAWYSYLFGEAWSSAFQTSLGRAPDMSNVAVSQSVGAINTVILVTGLAWVLRRLGVTGLAAAGTAGLVWLFFNFTTMAIDWIYMALSPTLVAINMGYQLAAYLIAGAVIGLMPAKA